MFKPLKITPVFARLKTPYRRSGKSCCITPLPYKGARQLFSGLMTGLEVMMGEEIQ